MFPTSRVWGPLARNQSCNRPHRQNQTHRFRQAYEAVCPIESRCPLVQRIRHHHRRAHHIGVLIGLAQRLRQQNRADSLPSHLLTDRETPNNVAGCPILLVPCEEWGSEVRLQPPPAYFALPQKAPCSSESRGIRLDSLAGQLWQEARSRTRSGRFGKPRTCKTR